MKYDKAMIKTAKVWAEESYCRKRQVGAVIATNGHIVSTGYNGTVSGMKNDCENIVAYECPKCKRVGSLVSIRQYERFDVCEECSELIDIEVQPIYKSSEFVIHAEQNAILDCAKRGISTIGTTMYTTHSPCKNCAKLIAGAGIVRVVYETDYKDLDGIKFLQDCNIKVEKYGK